MGISSTVHPDNEDYIECEITISELEDLVGELSYEANHNRKNGLLSRHVISLSLWKVNYGMRNIPKNNYILTSKLFL